MKIKNFKFRTALTLIIAIGVFTVFGAQGSNMPAPQPKIDFDKSVLPIFQRSCFPCHATSLTNVQSVLPNPDFVKRQEVEAQHGQDDFTMGPQFPFPDDDRPKKQLDKMEKKLRGRRMPPKAQQKLKLGMALSDSDRQLLLDWIGQMRADYPN